MKEQATGCHTLRREKGGGRGRRIPTASIGRVVFALMIFGAAAAPGSAVAASCGGAAMLGGAQLMCSNTGPAATTQLCNFSWALLTMDNQTKVAEGSFLLPPGASNVQVYQASGFNSQLSQPIILCQQVRSAN